MGWVSWETEWRGRGKGFEGGQTNQDTVRGSQLRDRDMLTNRHRERVGSVEDETATRKHHLSGSFWERRGSKLISEGVWD
jgi:hypothetical protein